jgi:hypothetical protein
MTRPSRTDFSQSAWLKPGAGCIPPADDSGWPESKRGCAVDRHDSMASASTSASRWMSCRGAARSSPHVPGIPYTSQSEQRRGAASERRDMSSPIAFLCIEYRSWPGGREAFAIDHAQIEVVTNALLRFAVRARRRSGDGPPVERRMFKLGSGSDFQRHA